MCLFVCILFVSLKDDVWNIYILPKQLCGNVQAFKCRISLILSLDSILDVWNIYILQKQLCGNVQAFKCRIAFILLLDSVHLVFYCDSKREQTPQGVETSIQTRFFVSRGHS